MQSLLQSPSAHQRPPALTKTAWAAAFVWKAARSLCLLFARLPGGEVRAAAVMVEASNVARIPNVH